MDQPLPFAPVTPVRRWRILLADSEVRVVEALTFRIEGGALVMTMSAGCVAAWAPGQWLQVEPEPTS
jgi:hypothetical protein